jgi:hypothetical protein
MFVLLAPIRIPICVPFIMSKEPVFIGSIFIPGICSIGVAAGLADGIDLLVCAGEGEASGIFIPGVGTGVDEGDGFGVGEGIGIECPECCAIADSAMTRDIATTSKRQMICEVLIRDTRSLPSINGAA